MIVVLVRYQYEFRSFRVDALPMTAEILAAEPQEAVTDGIQFATVDRPIELTMPALPVSTDTALDIVSPRIDPEFRADVARFTARAELAPGTAATILLILDISVDGLVASARVVRSDSGEAANAAALAYAHETRWIPGMVGGEPRAMQASLTVILGE